jgi:mannose-6-phosphate isomerase-like protein (cupin superfamily)
MSKVFDSKKVELEYNSIESSQAISPSDIQTGFAEAGETNKLKTGVWRHPVGISTDTEVDEVFVVIEGKGRVILKDGTILNLYPGGIITSSSSSSSSLS